MKKRPLTNDDMRDNEANTFHANRYNGWKNYQTWNVALWIHNDERLYNIARAEKNYAGFLVAMTIEGSTETQDGVKWLDDAIDIDVINHMIKEFA